MPPASFTDVPRYRLHKATGLGVVTLDGRDFYLGKQGTPQSLEAYHRRVSEWLANGRQLLPTADDVTVVELIVAFMPRRGLLPQARRHPHQRDRQLPPGAPPPPPALWHHAGAIVRAKGAPRPPAGDDPPGLVPAEHQHPGQPHPLDVQVGGLARADPVGRLRGACVAWRR